MDHHFPNPGDQYYNYQPQPIEVMPELNSISTLIMDLGIPACVILASFWFIRYQSEQSKKEREEMWAKDTTNDDRLMKLVETSTTIMQEMRASIDRNTDTMKELMQEFRYMEKRG